MEWLGVRRNRHGVPFIVARCYTTDRAKARRSFGAALAIEDVLTPDEWRKLRPTKPRRKRP